MNFIKSSYCKLLSLFLYSLLNLRHFENLIPKLVIPLVDRMYNLFNFIYLKHKPNENKCFLFNDSHYFASYMA